MKNLNSLTKKLRILSISLALIGLVVLPSTASAADPVVNCSTSLDCGAGFTCQGTSTELKAGTGTCLADTFGLNPIGNQVKGKLGNQDLRETAANLINVLLGLLGLIAVVIVLAGGFKWMTSGGNEEKTGEAKKMIGAGVIGLAIILSAWAISLFVINQLSSATGGEAAIPDQNPADPAVPAT